MTADLPDVYEPGKPLRAKPRAAAPPPPDPSAHAAEVDGYLADLRPGDLRTRSGKTARHTLEMAGLSLSAERRAHTALRQGVEREARRIAEEAAKVRDTYTQRLEDISATYTTHENIATVHSPKVTDPQGRGRDQRRHFTLAELEEACIRFRVAGARDLAPVVLEANYGGRGSVTCRVRDELPEAREERDRRLAVERENRRIRRAGAVVLAVVGPPLVLLVLAGLRWTYTLLLGWLL